jgi:cyclophilin family peptidyl-prolyl cis-trans isomerase
VAFAAAPLFAQTPAAPAGKPQGKPGAVPQPPIAVIETSKGTIKIRLFPEEAPKTVENFIALANKKFYDNLTFHRVEPGFVIQGGDPNGNGSGGPGYSIKNENNKVLRHNRGAVAMANAGRDTAGSQFYVVITKPAPHLDEKHEDGMSKYTIFGQVVTGLEVVDAINALSRGQPDNTATEAAGVRIADCGQLRKGTLKPNLELRRRARRRG